MPRQPRGCPVAPLLLVFTVLPLCELSILVWLSYRTSFLFTLAVVLTSGILGATLARWQGVRVWREASREMAMGRFPADSMIDGVIILVGGVMLVTPGLITDLIGLSTLIPPIRSLYRAKAKSFFKPGVGGTAGAGAFRVYTFGGRTDAPPPSADQPAEEKRHLPFDEATPFDRIKKDGQS